MYDRVSKRVADATETDAPNASDFMLSGDD